MKKFFFLLCSLISFAVACFAATPTTYCVIDLSQGSNATNYPLMYLDEPPEGGFNTDEFKTTKLVLKCIPASSFIMGEDQNNQTHRVTLTRPFYMGLFEVTQKQWKLVMGSNPAHDNGVGDTYPVYYVSYDMIRGSNLGAQWPASAAVDAESFMGKLQAKTGLNFDLPTEAQWEYACRAGTTSTYFYGDSVNGNYMWYKSNANTTKTVGTREANTWGLYDMHGNVWEWSLDWNGTLSYGTDPKGSSSGSNRVPRGGGWSNNASTSTSFGRGSSSPSYADYNSGFRLSRTINESSLCSVSSASTKMDTGSSPRTAAMTESITYSTAWESADTEASAIVSVNGETLQNAVGAGIVDWVPPSNGVFTLTHSVYANGVQVGNTLPAVFNFNGYEAPVISPVSGITFNTDSLSVSMYYGEGSEVHYTLDGTTPTLESPVYSRFKIHGRTTVKAIAFYPNGGVSEMTVAEYARGNLAVPVISLADGSSFEHSNQEVSIARSGTDGTLRYTLDGNDPTASSPAYEGPFTVSETTTVKAKIFGDQFFDSPTATSVLTRVWLQVATPVVTAASSFTGSKTKVELSCATEGALVRYTTNGNDPNTHAMKYKGPFYVTGTCTVKAKAWLDDYTPSEIGSLAITKEWCIGDTMGKPDHTFTTGGNVGFYQVDDGSAPLGESMRSGQITHNQVSEMSTVVNGPGTISFKWKASCEHDYEGLYDWDHGEFSIDGEVKAKIDGLSADWEPKTFAISGTGAHTLVWRYVKDIEEEANQDCIWVADYLWQSSLTATQTTATPVPYAWLMEKLPDEVDVDEYDVYEATAKSLAANGKNTVEECYVAGLVPTDETAEFRAVISIANGETQVSWEPRLDAAEEAKRVYTILGRESLTEDQWTAPTNSTHRFFRVKVQMK